jgi:hypothetical protein
VFGLPGSSAPATTTIDEFFLEPLTTDHVELDYAAVMDTREWLREWSGSTWPADDFTVDENREDLARHQREHEEGVAFTFTVLRSDAPNASAASTWRTPTDSRRRTPI